MENVCYEKDNTFQAQKHKATDEYMCTFASVKLVLIRFAQMVAKELPTVFAIADSLLKYSYHTICFCGNISF